MTTTQPVPPCPECAADKHRNCDGMAWDFVADEGAYCPCLDGEHPIRFGQPPIPEGLCGVGGCTLTPHPSSSSHTWERP
jgi:hypothetical protein